MRKSLISLFCLIPLLVFADGASVTSNRYSNSLSGGIGPTGATGPAGPSGPTGPTGPMGTFSSAYGQLYCSTSQNVTLTTANQWVAIPFNAFSPSSNVTGSTGTPASMTILEPGVYEVNISLYFSSEDSAEYTFNQTTYTLGTSVNGGAVTAGGAVYAGEAGRFSLNYRALQTFSVNDYIEFYIETSAVGGYSIFDNIVTILSGNASVIRISQ